VIADLRKKEGRKLGDHPGGNEGKNFENIVNCLYQMTEKRKRFLIGEEVWAREHTYRGPKGRGDKGGVQRKRGLSCSFHTKGREFRKPSRNTVVTK